jgi:hypothetical protein
MAKRRRNWIIVVVLAGVATIVAYWAVSGVVNAQAPTQAYPGWIAVLQPSHEAIPEQVELSVEALYPGAPGDHPALKYTVLACGDRPFHGVLLIGGQARLDHAVVVDQLGVSSADTTAAVAPRLDDLPDITIEQDAASWDLGPAQLLHVAIDQLTPCTRAASAEQPLQLGTGEMVGGLARAPVQRTARYFGLSGPRSSQVWPLVGRFPEVSPNDLGEFHGIRGLSGPWMVPPTLHNKVSIGSLAARVSLDLAVPPLTDTSDLVWNSFSPLRPAVRLTNVDVMAAWQQRLVVAGIFLGIGGSLLASLLFEWARPKQPGESSTVGTVTPPLMMPKRTARPATALVVASLALIAYVLGRSRR